MTPVTIKQNKILSLNLSFNTDFNGGNLLSDASVVVTPIIAPFASDEVFIAIYFEFSCQSMSDDFKLNCNLTVPFTLNNTVDINKFDLYKCIELTKEHLQNIINATFAGQRPIKVSTIGIDTISDMLDDKIQNLH